MDGAVLAEAGPNAEAGILSVLRRVLCTGNAGNAMFGGPLEARDGRGSAVAMMSLSGRQEMEILSSSVEKEDVFAADERAVEKNQLVLLIVSIHRTKSHSRRLARCQDSRDK